MLWILTTMIASADTLTLDNGAVIEGELIRYAPDGECAVEVRTGPLQDTTLTLPCARIMRFERALVAPASPLPLAAPQPVASPVEASPAAAPPVEAPPAAPPVEVLPTEPVAAPPEVSAIESAPEQAPFAGEAVADDGPATEPTAEEPSAEETPWSDASGAPAAGTVTGPTVGGVVLPALPNLRIFRAGPLPPAEGEADEAL